MKKRKLKTWTMREIAKAWKMTFEGAITWGPGGCAQELRERLHAMKMGKSRKRK